MKTIIRDILFLAIMLILFLPVKTGFVEKGEFPANIFSQEVFNSKDWREPEAGKNTVNKPQNLRPMDTLPARWKNTKYLPVIGNQGQLGSCFSWAKYYYYKTYQEAKKQGWQNPDWRINPERVFSPAWGFLFGSGFEEIIYYGAATWEEMPYQLPLNDTFWPNEEEWKRFMTRRGKETGSIVCNTPEGIEALKERLVSGEIAAVSLLVFDNFAIYPNGQYTDNGVFYDNVDSTAGAHYLTLVGYDDEIEYETEEGTKKGAFLLANSWGPDWGVVEPNMGDEEPNIGTKGFVWIAYDYFLEGKCGNLAEFLIDRPETDYEPEKFALIGIDHTKGRQLVISILGGEYDNPDWEKRAMPTGGPYSLEKDVHGYVWSDLTDYKDYDNLTYHLKVLQLNEQFGFGGGAGEVVDFAIQDGEGPPFITSPDTPLATVNDNYIYLRTGVFEEGRASFDGLRLRRGGITWADFSGNGHPDLLAVGNNWAEGRKSSWSDMMFTGLFVNKGDETFAPVTDAGLPQLSNGMVAAADYNNDGYPDIVLYGDDWESDGEFSGIFRNNGNNTFTDIEVELPENIESLNWVDYNNDGLPDLAVSTTTQVLFYRNAGENTFIPQPPVIDAAEYGEDYTIEIALAWGDADGDGLVDLAVTGNFRRTRFDYIPASTVFKNLGNGIFEDLNVELPNLYAASLAWGDYNHNGLQDLVLTGKNKDNNEPFSAVYRNNGDGTFTDIDAPLGGAWGGVAAWGDLNNDGWADLVITGRDSDPYKELFDPDNIDPVYGPYPEHRYPHQTKVFFNDGEGSFREVSAGLPRVSQSSDYIGFQKAYNNSLSLVDYNGNGDLDIFMSGTKTLLYEELPDWIYTGIYRNGMTDAFNKSNTNPEPPQELSARKSDEPGKVVFTWADGNDAETPAEGLYYNIRVGTAPGAGDIVSGANAFISPGRIIVPGNEYTLSGLSDGDIYWAVQTLDAGYRASAWSAEQSFSVESLALSAGDVNGDGSVTVADAIIVLRHVVGLIDICEVYGSEALARAKSSGGADITVSDAIIILRRVVGLIS